MKPTGFAAGGTMTGMSGSERRMGKSVFSGLKARPHKGQAFRPGLGGRPSMRSERSRARLLNGAARDLSGRHLSFAAIPGAQSPGLCAVGLSARVIAHPSCNHAQGASDRATKRRTAPHSKTLTRSRRFHALRLEHCEMRLHRFLNLARSFMQSERIVKVDAPFTMLSYSC